MWNYLNFLFWGLSTLKHCFSAVPIDSFFTPDLPLQHTTELRNKLFGHCKLPWWLLYYNDRFHFQASQAHKALLVTVKEVSLTLPREQTHHRITAETNALDFLWPDQSFSFLSFKMPSCPTLYRMWSSRIYGDASKATKSLWFLFVQLPHLWTGPRQYRL